MRVYVHVYMYVYVHMYVCVYVCIYIYIRARVGVHMHSCRRILFICTVQFLYYMHVYYRCFLTLACVCGGGLEWLKKERTGNLYWDNQEEDKEETIVSVTDPKEEMVFSSNISGMFCVMENGKNETNIFHKMRELLCKDQDHVFCTSEAQLLFQQCSRERCSLTNCTT